MKVSMKYAYPEKGTRNGRIYPQEVLEKAFNEPSFKERCVANSVPVTSEDGKLIGMGTATLEDYKVVRVDAEIFDPTYIKILKESKNSSALTLAGTGAVEYTDDKAIVTVVDFTHAMFTPCPAVDIKEIEYKD